MTTPSAAAREAALTAAAKLFPPPDDHIPVQADNAWCRGDMADLLLAFAARAVAEERERCCAAVCDGCKFKAPTLNDEGDWWHAEWSEPGDGSDYCEATEIVTAAAIRARGAPVKPYPSCGADRHAEPHSGAGRKED